MYQNSSRLSYLMDIMNVTGKELSEAINIDNTTVSKWKNNQRKLKYRSKYPKMIATYFFNKEFDFKHEDLISMLKEYYPGLNSNNTEEILETLCRWLTEEDNNQIIESKDDGDYKAIVNVYTGINGWDKAIDDFWNTINLLDKKHTVIIGDYGDIDWKNEDELVRKSMNYIINSARRGNEVIIIDRVTDEYKPYDVLLRWLPMYLSDNVNIYYYEDSCNNNLKQSIYGVDGEIALTGCAIDNVQESNLTTVYKDKANVEFYNTLLQSNLDNSKKLIETINTCDVVDMQKIIEENLKRARLTYLLNNLPTFRNMPLELLEKILDDNNVEESYKKRCIKAYKIRREIRNRCNYRQIYNLEAIENALNNEYIIDYDLSAIIGKDIKISRDDFICQLKYIAKTTTTKSYQMVLVPFSEISLLSKSAEIIAQDDSIVLAWDASKYKKRMYCKELTVIGGLFEYMEEVWSSIPLICKNEKWTQKQLDRILDLA